MEIRQSEKPLYWNDIFVLIVSIVGAILLWEEIEDNDHKKCQDIAE